MTKTTSEGQSVIVMGVSGSGKSTIAKRLADELGEGAIYLDADDYHSEEHKKKMASGHSLTDEDRLPWLQKLVKVLDSHLERDPSQTVFLACSSLKKWYRDILREAILQHHPVRFLYLDGSRDLLYSRLSSRQGHYFQASGLDGQLEQLEKPDPAVETDCVSISVDAPIKEIIENARKALGI
ncbi:gluconokinase [Powellomyces hirtus]|uniref:Gluconokinase n=1 Tax=Powellomyces hirtus TaxID=109895 RepID=A0A507EFC8_9FUNG|nr:thermoresistant gluconokinase [Powellomyces hirtus]TPX62853.1 gluconokinase [Powellomyces hirtus]